MRNRRCLNVQAAELTVFQPLKLRVKLQRPKKLLLIINKKKQQIKQLFVQVFNRNLIHPPIITTSKTILQFHSSSFSFGHRVFLPILKLTAAKLGTSQPASIEQINP